MYRVSELLEEKANRGGAGLATGSPGDSSLEAARLMNAKHIGALMICDTDGSLVGIVSERDILTRVVAAERDAADTLVAEIMTTSVLTCEPDTRLEEVRKVMREQRIRHLPVIEDGKIRGMVSIGDLNFAEAETLVETIRSLEAYIAGV